MDKQQIKQILDNAPEGAVDFCKVGLYGCLFRFYYDSGVHEDVEIESLTDVGCPYATIETLRNQLALIEENEKLKAQLEFVANRVNIDEKGNASFHCGGFYDVERTLNNLEELSND